MSTFCSVLGIMYEILRSILIMDLSGNLDLRHWILRIDPVRFLVHGYTNQRQRIDASSL